MAELSTLGHVIKEAYENQTNTNAFTDPDKAKLAGLTPLATSGQWGDVQGKPAFIAAGASEEEARQAIGAMDAAMAGAAGGVAQLDAAGTVPLSQINLEGLAYKGLWDAASNAPAIADGAGTDADFFFASSTATVDLGSGPQDFQEGDIVIYFDGVWSRLGSSQIVQSVNGMIGNVEITRQSLGAMADTYQPDWDDVQNKPNIPAMRGSIGAPVPAVRQYFEADQSIPGLTNTQISNWGDGYDHFGMRVDGNFIVPPWASHARVTCSVSSEYIHTGRFLHVEIRRNGSPVGGGACPGMALQKYPVARADTGIMSVSPGDVFMVVVWHNGDVPRNVRSGALSMINIELFEAI